MFITHIELLNTNCKKKSSLTMVRETISQTSIAKTSIRKTSSVRKTSSMRKTSIAVGISEMSSLGLSNLRSVNWGNWEHWVEGGGNKRLRVEGGSNSVIDGSNGQTRVGNTESCSVSNVLNL